MFQDFNFKIVHKVGTRHANVDALSCNPIGSHDEDEDEDFGVEIQYEKKNFSVAQVWKSTTSSPHILTISQDVGAELMENEKYEEINQCGEFAKENSNILAKVFAPKRKANRISTPDTDYWGLICEAQVMVDVKINPIDVNSSEEDIEIKETGKRIDIWKDETCMTLLFGSILDQVLDDATKVDLAKKTLLNYH